MQVLEEKLVKRKVSLKALDVRQGRRGDEGQRPPDRDAQRRHLRRQGREIGKFVKGLGLKGVQHQVQGEQLRVTGKKRDDLQAAIAAAARARLRRAAAVQRTSATVGARQDRPDRVRVLVAQTGDALLGRRVGAEQVARSSTLRPVSGLMM